MFQNTGVDTRRVIEMSRRDNGQTREAATGLSGRVGLGAFLAGLRAEMDGLAIRLAREYGRGSQVTMRAEEIAHSVQRLEWALEREHSSRQIR